MTTHTDLIARLRRDAGSRIVAESKCHEAANALESLEQQNAELLAAAENLVRVKGRHHTEQAYKELEAAIAKVKQP